MASLSIKDLIRYARICTIQLITAFRSSRLELKENIVIIAPHPDDEVLACSGLIKQCLSSKKNVNVIILTQGERTHSECCSEEETRINRSKLTTNALEILHLPVKNLYRLKFPDRGVSAQCEETKELHSLLNAIKPDTIFIPHSLDRWRDHIEAGNLIKDFYQEKTGILIYEYCVWFWFWFHNTPKPKWKNSFILKMGEDERRLKCRAIDAYVTPLATCGKPWSGQLPTVLIHACKWDKELFFRIK